MTIISPDEQKKLREDAVARQRERIEREDDPGLTITVGGGDEMLRHELASYLRRCVQGSRIEFGVPRVEASLPKADKADLRTKIIVMAFDAAQAEYVSQLLAAWIARTGFENVRINRVNHVVSMDYVTPLPEVRSTLVATARAGVITDLTYPRAAQGNMNDANASAYQREHDAEVAAGRRSEGVIHTQTRLSPMEEALRGKLTIMGDAAETYPQGKPMVFMEPGRTLPKAGHAPFEAEGYEPLARVLAAAFNQSAHGKGKERHARDKPFLEQPIMEIARMVGLGGHAYQICKKVQEATAFVDRKSIDWRNRAVAEFYGAIIYSAAAILLIEELANGDLRKEEQI